MSEKARIDELLNTENDQLKKLNDIVLKAIEEEKLLSQKLYQFEDHHPSVSNRLADSMATFGGSWRFIFFFLGFMLLWMLSNLVMGSHLIPFHLFY